ncbi:kazal-type proteinase inhibitor [Elysia marginata]|uniref:Kazal-type proteinase inhibitor n=1 Tax=Elysia marginata TaxID=1093978 RepID=A0AAV4FU68_9GAST|nr:kazal-type proteinase inhibitor [Elysia marginata]
MAIFTLPIYLLLSCAASLTFACDPSPTPAACPLIHAPVCVTFHKTFSNPCEMESQLCRLAQEGFHFVEKEENRDCCVGPMPLLASPTCGSDGKTYGNRWHMSYSACRNKDYVLETTPDNCPDFPQDWLTPVS